MIGLTVAKQFADSQVADLSTCGLVADSEFLKFVKLFYFICILNLDRPWSAQKNLYGV